MLTCESCLVLSSGHYLVTDVGDHVKFCRGLKQCLCQILSDDCNFSCRPKPHGVCTVS